MTEAPSAPATAPAAVDKEHPPKPTNTINISLQRSPVFYANLAKRFINGGESEVKLTGLGDATNTVVGAAEILKRQDGMVNVKKMETSMSDRGLSRLLVVVTKGPRFDELYEEPKPAQGTEAPNA
eukprot:NODE_6454_length_533_cov_26.864532_g6289_i0.p2 GENE.NODE_6454_length_533_cov_26.864532_g6289_i0~~NODE_6454_length_533_cov_26.864532_g6289_i0.p2  ORF type:complete len:145 (-),score=29.81 NODE_6454_length_533_cov_26.864532_g6289_i0:98-472(-)